MPLIPFVDVLVKVGTAPPPQIFSDVPKLNVGVTRGMIVTGIVIGMPHCPPAGVNVYEPEVVLLITAGFHVPVMPLFDVVDNVGGVVPAQIGGTEVNVGINMGFDKTIPINKFVVHPFIPKEKDEYNPAFNPVMITCPDALAVNDIGPTAAPSSV